jgi:hypothetical protein
MYANQSSRDLVGKAKIKDVLKNFKSGD